MQRGCKKIKDLRWFEGVFAKNPSKHFLTQADTTQNLSQMQRYQHAKILGAKKKRCADHLQNPRTHCRTLFAFNEHLVLSRALHSHKNQIYNVDRFL